MDRQDYYFRQLVTEGELDGTFNDVELGDRRQTTDADLIGIVFGGDLSPAGPANLTVILDSPTAAYDDQGQRIYISGLAPIDMTVDSNLVPTDVAIAGNKKILSVFIEFDRVLSDPRQDGNAQQVFFQVRESFQLTVVQGGEQVNPTPPPLEQGKLLCADVELSFGTTQITSNEIDHTRQQTTFLLNTANLSISAGTINEVLQAQLQILEDHIQDLGNAHAADAITYLDGSGGWADATGLDALNVEAALDEIVDDLGGLDGAAKVGFDPVATQHVGIDVEAAIREAGTLAGTNTWPNPQTFSTVIDAPGIRGGVATPVDLPEGATLAPGQQLVGDGTTLVATGTVNVDLVNAANGIQGAPATPVDLPEGAVVPATKTLTVDGFTVLNEAVTINDSLSVLGANGGSLDSDLTAIMTWNGTATLTGRIRVIASILSAVGDFGKDGAGNMRWHDGVADLIGHISASGWFKGHGQVDTAVPAASIDLDTSTLVAPKATSDVDIVAQLQVQRAIAGDVEVSITEVGGVGVVGTVQDFEAPVTGTTTYLNLTFSRTRIAADTTPRVYRVTVNGKGEDVNLGTGRIVAMPAVG